KPRDPRLPIPTSEEDPSVKRADAFEALHGKPARLRDSIARKIFITITISPYNHLLSNPQKEQFSNTISETIESGKCLSHQFQGQNVVRRIREVLDGYRVPGRIIDEISASIQAVIAKCTTIEFK
ncbi:hypothetical protein HN709_04750, partial [Candidatus Peregrinibacteria bacterium]|nr:hypothetical protein [Candidatus Peregrinibacteria bacterium]